MRSYPQARDVTELLLAVNPSALEALRERGMLAYQLNDLSASLRDLQTYLKLSAVSGEKNRDRKEDEEVWEQIKTIRKRLAALN
jgi:regulator of sirC expression with transglutaminase-like and TPR domain